MTRGPGCGRAASPTSAGIRGSRRARPGPARSSGSSLPLRPPPLPPSLPCPALPRRLTQQKQAVRRFVSQPLLLQLLLYFFVGFSLRFLIDTLILRFAVAQTPHRRRSGGMSGCCLRAPGSYGGRGEGGGEEQALNPDISAALSLRFFPPLCSNKMVSGRSLIKTEFVCFPPREGCEGPRWPCRAGKGGGRDPRSNA